MAFINTNHGEIKIDKQLNVTMPPHQEQATSDVANPSEKAEKAEKEVKQLSKRQVVILMTSLLDITLNPDYTNQKQFAVFLSQLTGLSAEALRQTVMKVAKEGLETPQAHKDSCIVADLVEPVDSHIARKIRNGAMDI